MKILKLINFQQFNPIIVVEAEEAISQTLKILNDIDNALVQIDKSEDKIDFKVKSEVIGISDSKFKLRCELNLLKEDKSKVGNLLVTSFRKLYKYDFSLRKELQLQ